MKTRKKIQLFILMIISLFLISTSNITYAVNNTPPAAVMKMQMQLQSFYKNPSAKNFISLFNLIDNIMDLDAYNPGGINPLICFAATTIKTHAKLSDDLVKQYASLSPKVSRLVYTALYLAEKKDAINKINQQYGSITGTRTGLTQKLIGNIKINDNPDNLDLIWASYYATGNTAYLKQILEYIGSNAPLTQARNMTLSAALWSLDANARQDKTIKEKVLNILAKNPQLHTRMRRNRENLESN